MTYAKKCVTIKVVVYNILRGEQMKNIKYIVSILVLLFAFGFTACLAEDVDKYIVTLCVPEGEECAALFSDGENYPETLKETAELLCDADDAVNDVYSKKGVVSVKDDETLQSLIDAGVVEYYEPNQEAFLYGYYPSENPYFSLQWSHKAVNSEYAWNAGIFGNGVRVGVIDSGVYPNSDFGSSLAPGYNYGYDYDIDPTDSVTNTNDIVSGNGHGTLVAGVISAQCNDVGAVGLAHRATVVPLRAVKANGTLYTTEITAAIYGAVDDFDCDVINLSLGFNNPVQTVRDAISYAIENNCIVVAAAGNYTSTDDKTEEIYKYPAAYEEVISVANVMPLEEGGYSISTGSIKNDRIDIAAPGTGIYGPKKHGATDTATDGVCKNNGTSFASPLVAAAAALAKSVDPNMTQSEFSTLITSTANDAYVIPGGLGATAWGSGMLDVEAMTKKLLEGKNAYVSEVDIQPYGENVSVYIHNPTNAKKHYGLIVRALNPAEKRIDITLGAYETYELSFTQSSFYGKADVSVVDADNADAFIKLVSHKLPRQLGDIYGDGRINSLDAVKLAQYLAGWSIEFSAEDLECADYKTDGRVNSLDAVKLAQKIAGWAIT